MKKLLFTRAHKLTRETVAIYGCDYRATFGAALAIVSQQLTDNLSKYARKGYDASYDATGQLVLSPLANFDFHAGNQVIKVRGKGGLIAKRQKQTEHIQSYEGRKPIDNRPGWVKTAQKSRPVIEFLNY